MKSVFISSTSHDLVEYRAIVDKIISRYDLRPINMDNFGSQPGGAVETSLREVEKADLFIGIIAHRYGHIPEGMEKSVTQQEYDKAIELGIPRLMYIVDPDFNWDEAKIEITAQDKLTAFKQSIDQSDVRSHFTTPDDLASKVSADLYKWIESLPDESIPTVNAPQASGNWGLYGIITLVIALLGLLIAFVSILPQTQRDNMLYAVGLVSASETATHTPTATLAPTHTPTITPTPFEPNEFEDNEIGVVLGNFETLGNVQRGIEREIELEFEDSSINYERFNDRVRDRDHARSLLEQYNAIILIWGEELNNTVVVYYEIIPRETQEIDTSVDRIHSSLSDFADLTSFESYISDGMDSVYVVKFIEGQVTYLQGDYERALPLFTEAINLIPTGREDEVEASALYFYRGYTYRNLSNDQEAISDYSRAIELDPNFVEAYNNRGNAYSDLGEYALAISDFDRSIELNPDFATPYTNRGITYYEIGDFEASINDQNSAIELDPDSALAYNNRGGVYYYLEEYESALDDYTRAIELDPNYFDAYRNRGILYNDLGQYELAITNHTRVINLDPHYAQSYVDRGNAYYSLGEYEEALEDYERAIELDPNYALAYNNRGNIYYVLGVYDLAFEDYEQSIKLDPEYVLVYTNRAYVYYQLEEFELATADYSRAIQIDPNRADVFWGRGDSYFELGIEYYEEAIADYEQYAELTGTLEPYMETRIAQMQDALANQD